MKKLMQAAMLVLGLTAAAAATEAAAACGKCGELLVKRAAELTVMKGKLGKEVSITESEGPPVTVVTYHLLRDGDGARIELNLAAGKGLEKKAEQLAGKRVAVTGTMVHRREMDAADVEADVPVAVDLFGDLSFHKDGSVSLRVFHTDGKTYKLDFNGDRDLLARAERLQFARFGVQARVRIEGDRATVLELWPSDPHHFHGK